MTSRQQKEFTVEEVAKVRFEPLIELMLTTFPVPSITRRAIWYDLELLILGSSSLANAYRLSGSL